MILIRKWWEIDCYINVRILEVGCSLGLTWLWRVTIDSRRNFSYLPSALSLDYWPNDWETYLTINYGPYL